MNHTDKFVLRLLLDFDYSLFSSPLFSCYGSGEGGGYGGEGYSCSGRRGGDEGDGSRESGGDYNCNSSGGYGNSGGGCYGGGGYGGSGSFYSKGGGIF